MKSLADIGRSYLDLLKRIGVERTKEYAQEVESLFAPSCKKIVNGEVWYESRDDFLPQLLSTGKAAGLWNIQNLAIIPGIDGKTVVIHFIAPTENIGIWNAITILRCNEQQKIIEIDEIFNSYEGSQVNSEFEYAIHE